MDLKVGFLGGGNMALSLTRGFLNKDIVKASNVIASVTGSKQIGYKNLQELGVTVTTDNKAVVSGCRVLFIAVKPHIVPVVLEEVRSIISEQHLVISVAAGISLETLAKLLPPLTRTVRSMPNTLSSVGCGSTAYTPNTKVTDTDCQLVETLFSAVGVCMKLPEPLIDSVCGLSGSGPAFAYLAIESLSDGGVKMGLPRAVATQFAAQTLLGAAKMVLESGHHPGQLKDSVCSPGGTTIAGIHALERAGVRAGFMDAVEAAVTRARQLDK